MILCLVVLTQYRLVTDRRTHNDGIYRASIASRGNKTTLCNKNNIIQLIRITVFIALFTRMHSLDCGENQPIRQTDTGGVHADSQSDNQTHTIFAVHSTAYLYTK